MGRGKRRRRIERIGDSGRVRGGPAERAWEWATRLGGRRVAIGLLRYKARCGAARFARDNSSYRERNRLSARRLSRSHARRQAQASRPERGLRFGSSKRQASASSTLATTCYAASSARGDPAGRTVADAGNGQPLRRKAAGRGVAAAPSRPPAAARDLGRRPRPALFAGGAVASEARVAERTAAGGHAPGSEGILWGAQFPGRFDSLGGLTVPFAVTTVIASETGGRARTFRALRTARGLTVPFAVTTVIASEIRGTGAAPGHGRDGGPALQKDSDL